MSPSFEDEPEMDNHTQEVGLRQYFESLLAAHYREHDMMNKSQETFVKSLAGEFVSRAEYSQRHEDLVKGMANLSRLVYMGVGILMVVQMGIGIILVFVKK